MPQLTWSEIRDALTAAIRDALPLQVRKVSGERIAGVGLHMDAYYGSAGLYLLSESAAHSLSPKAADNIGDWPISTDWKLQEDHAQAFAAHWGWWDQWFHDHLDDFDEASGVEKSRGLLRIACEAMRAIELAGHFDAFPKTAEFKVIIAEHDEPDHFSVERYGLFVRTGTIRCHGDPA